MTLDTASTEWIEVQSALMAPGTATYADYQPVFGGRGLIPPGTTTVNLSLDVLGDAEVEEDETLTLSILSVVGAEIGTPTATITIADDDAAQEPGDVTKAVSGGETVSTGDVATADTPVQTSIAVPAGVSGTLTVDAQPSATSPEGYELFGQQLLIEGPEATADAPYAVSFTVDKTVLGGITPSDVQVFRNGALLTDCTDPVAAIPDPCLVSRGYVPDESGDALVTVRTSHFSTWTLGRLDYDLTGPFQPVDAAPIVNTAKAGSAIPVKFKLGGDRGLNVLASGYPKTVSSSCTSGGGGGDEVEQTVEADSSALAYDAASATYTYIWKTPRAFKGCSDLILRLRDGSELRANFNLR